MMVLLVIALILGILIFVVGLPYCLNNRKIIYKRNKKYFNAPVAYLFTDCIIAGICMFGFGIVSLIMPKWNIGDINDSISIMMYGIAIFVVGLLIGLIPINKASKDNHKGVIKDMFIASIGSTCAVFKTFIPFISDYSQKKYEQYLAEEKQRENMQRAEQERIDNSYIVNNDTGERYSLNSDGTKFKDSNGDWVSVNEATRTGDYKLIR